MSIYLPRVLSLVVCLVALSAVVYPIARADAAESVVLRYGSLEGKVSVPELSIFAQTGEVSRSLQAYLKMTNKKPDDLRSALTTQISVDPILLSKILNHSLGELLLDRVSSVVHTPTERASREAMRSALVTSALPDGKIAAIELLENYPTQEVYVNVERLAEIVETIERVSERVKEALPDIQL